MRQLLPCFIILSLAISTFAADCNNPLLTTFKLEKLANGPQTVSGLKYCKSLKDKSSCCSADTINTIQDKATTAVQRLTNYVSERDKKMVEARDKVLPGLQANFQTFKDSFTTLSTQLDAMNPGKDATMQSIIDMIKSMVNGMIESSNQIYQNMGTVKTKYGTYQKSRSTCMVELIKLQAASYCLACDPDYSSKGVSGSIVTMSDKVCKRLQAACFDYLDQSATQNGLLYSQVMLQSLDKMTTAMTAAMGNIASPNAGSSTSGLFDLSSSSEAFSSLTNDQLLAQLPSAKPSSCKSSTDCAWACTNLFKNGQIVDSAAVLGGATYEKASSSRLLEGEEGTRRLQNNAWDPDEDEAGVTVTFSDDPGNTNTANASVLKVGLMCVIGMIIAVLL